MHNFTAEQIDDLLGKSLDQRIQEYMSNSLKSSVNCL